MANVEVVLRFDSLDEMFAALGDRVIRAGTTIQVAEHAAAGTAAHAAAEAALDDEKPAEQPQKKRRGRKRTEETHPLVTATPENEVRAQPGVDDVKAALKQVNGAKGFTGTRAMLQSFGAEKVSDLDKSRYAEFIAACEKEVA